MTATTATDIRDTLAADPARTVQLLDTVSALYRELVEGFEGCHVDVQRAVYTLICRESTLGRTATRDEISAVLDGSIIDG